MPERTIKPTMHLPLIFRVLVSAAVLLLGWSAAASAQTTAANPPAPVLGWFEKPRVLAPGNLRFEQALQVNEHVVLLYQRLVRLNAESGTISVIGRVVDTAGRMGEEFSVMDGLPFIGIQPPPVFSAAADAKGRIFVAYSRDALTVSLLAGQGPTSAGDAGHQTLNFSEIGQLHSESTLVSPKLFLKADGGFVILATQSTTKSQNTLASHSTDGKTWSVPVMVDATLDGNINASPTWVQSGKNELVIFQSLNFTEQVTGVGTYYQLYYCRSDDGGLSWQAPVMLTNFRNPGDKADVPIAGYDNQRPLLSKDGDKIRLFWERGMTTDPRQIWTMDLDASGAIVVAPERVSDTTGGALSPNWLRYKGKEYLSWFSAASTGSKAWLGWKDKNGWTSQNFSTGRDTNALYPAFGFTNGKLHYFYYDRSSNTALDTALVYVEPDQKALAPIIVAGFDVGGRSRRAEIQFRLSPQADASGIVAYNYLVTTDPNADVPLRPDTAGSASIPPRTLDKDGTWYVRARAQDRAGNWSPISTVSYVLDTTPPDAVAFSPLELDEKGYLASNTYGVSWSRPAQDDVRDYAYSLQFLGNISLAEAFAKVIDAETLPEMGRLSTPGLSRRNVQNGIYLLAVWAYDQVGNRSPARIIQLFANKYIPSTVINFITVKEDLLGNRYLAVNGEGFKQQGTITRMVLDRNGIAPWDHEYFLAKGEFQVLDDRLISGLELNNLLSGSYLLGIEHSERGFEFSGRRLEFREHGVIKFGDFTIQSPSSYSAQVSHGFQVQGGSLMLWLIVAMLVAIMLVSSIQIRNVWRDSQLLERTALALADGRITPVWEEERKVRAMKKQQLGLRIKFTFFFLSLVIGVVLLVSIPLSSYTLDRQKTVLAQGLKDRLDVLMESLQSSSSIYLPTPESYATELAGLVGQGRIIPEVSYITISAQGRDNSSNFDTVWASNDKAITDEAVDKDRPITAVTQRYRMPYTVDGKELSDWFSGRSGIRDILSPGVEDLQKKFDTEVKNGLGQLPAELFNVQQQINALTKNTTPEGTKEAERLDVIRRNYSEQLSIKLAELGGGTLSQPAYDFANYNPAVTDYLFYKPIYFRIAKEKPEEARYYRGLVRIGVNTAPINDSINKTQSEMLQRILLFALIAVGSGLAVAIVLSSIIVGPIRRLVRGVESIREIIALDVQAQETKFDEFLKAGTIAIKSGDELATLGDSISEMVDGLYHAASANKELVAGADIQRMFMPLDLIEGTRGTVGGIETGKTEIFGYYEGAKGVSGDFINFQQISPGVWACIKCDVSGKGIPAALIMVEVATIFLSYFADWQRKEEERRKMVSSASKATKNDGILVPLVTTINDLVNERQFKGKFAAFDIVLYEENTGACVFCHAGDQLVYILRDKTRTVETIKLQSTPAAGMFSSKDQFPPFFRCREERNLLEVGDFLMFFTDGIDESRRFFRTPDFKPYLATDADMKAGRMPDEDHGTVAAQDMAADGTKLYEYEQFTWDRMIAVAEAVRTRQVYRLVKYINPVPDEVLEFDFTKLEPTGRNIVIALSAVEKVFRLIPDPQAGPEDRIKIDKVVDLFLKDHFRQYAGYFRYKREDFKNPLYFEYTHMKEEDQYDDLAYLIIKRK